MGATRRRCDRAGIHRPYVSAIEFADRNPAITVVERLAMSFDINASDLLK